MSGASRQRRTVSGRLSAVTITMLTVAASLMTAAGVARASDSPPARAVPVSALARSASRAVTVSSLDDSGYGTLRWAIRVADNAAPGISTRIEFTVAGTIRLLTALPALTADVTIDGQTAPGYAAGGPPAIGIDCGGHGGLAFYPGAAHSELLAVAVENASGDGVTISARDVTLNGDYIGLSVTGSSAGNHGSGIYLSAGAAGARIGLNPSGQPGLTANVISGNAGSGVVVAGAAGVTVVASRIGTNPAGTAGIGNGGDGIEVTARATGTEIGGTAYTDPATGASNNPTGSKGTVTPVFVVPALGNQISANGGDGVLISNGATRTTLNGNFIGTTASGDGPLGNRGDGVAIDHASRNSLVGCTFVNNPFVYYNVISGNGRNGLRVTDSDNVVVQGNFFGVGADNTTLIGNRGNGVLVTGSSANTQVGGVIPLGNVSSGNGRNGIEVTGRVHGFTTFNTFGGLLAFKGAAPNGRDGLLITATGRDNLARTNVFSGNRRNGIELAGNASGVTIDPDIAGLSTSGRALLPNGGDGLLLDGNAHGNVIGGSLRSVIPQNTFSGNSGYGVAITGTAYGNRVFSSVVGPAILGLTALGNRRGGILIAGRARGNLIGGLRRAQLNLISGDTGIGVTLTRGTRDNLVIGNYIGLNRVGRPLPNTGRPVVDRGRHNLIRRNRT